MENAIVYYDGILEENKLNVPLMQELYRGFAKNAENILKNSKEKGLTGEQLVDDYMTDVDRQVLFEYEHSDKRIMLQLQGYHAFENEPGEELDVRYVVEVQKADTGLMSAEDFEIGEEEQVIKELQEYGFPE